MKYEFLPPLSINAPVDLLYPFEPDATFMVGTQGARTQREFLSDVHALASKLPKRGYAINLCENRYDFLVSFCACLVNNTVNLLPPNRQANTLADLMADYPDVFCLVDGNLDLDGQFDSMPLIPVGKWRREFAYDASAALIRIPAQQIAALAFTSGSTGKPKPNRKPFGTLAGLARFLGAALLDDQASVMLATVPSQHMYGLETTIFMALQTPAVLHNEKPFYPADVKSLLERLEQPALIITTPTHLRALTQSGLEMPSAHRLLSATAPLDKPLALAAEQLFDCSLHEIYGCTEAGSMALRQSTQTDHWQLLDGFEFIQPDSTDITIADAPHLPEPAELQDIIELGSERQFLLKGRRADLINVAGKRASLANLTSHLLSLDGVIDGVVFMPEVPESTREARPVALVISERDERELIADYATRVDAAFIPRPLKKVSQLPRNATGKLTRQALLDLWSTFNDATV